MVSDFGQPFSLVTVSGPCFFALFLVTVCKHCCWSPSGHCLMGTDAGHYLCVVTFFVGTEPSHCCLSLFQITIPGYCFLNTVSGGHCTWSQLLVTCLGHSFGSLLLCTVPEYCVWWALNLATVVGLLFGSLFPVTIAGTVSGHWSLLLITLSGSLSLITVCGHCCWSLARRCVWWALSLITTAGYSGHSVRWVLTLITFCVHKECTVSVYLYSSLFLRTDSCPLFLDNLSAHYLLFLFTLLAAT